MSVAEIVVNKLANGWRVKRVGRRSFLTGVAVVGSALATRPLAYATRPMSAYNTVCGPSAGCNEGWSAFCCTINNGANQCPPGSFVAGWWKADQSGFCCGTARYYIDCNASCGSNWQCHCASGSCDQRRVACNQFRYGQCHQEIACYGPVVCRVVTCTPPWQFDKSCSSTTLTDNRTVAHTAPCLPGNCPSTLTKFYYDRGGPGGSLGAVTAPERTSGVGGQVLVTKNAVIYQLTSGPVQVMPTAMLTRYREMGGHTGTLGEITGAVVTFQGVQVVPFQRGVLFQGPGSVRAVVGAIHTHWKARGGLNRVGLPDADQATTPRGVRQNFRGGIIFDYKDFPPYFVPGHYLALWKTLGNEGGKLGEPRSEESHPAGRPQAYQNFQRGRLFHHPNGRVVALLDPLLQPWRGMKGDQGPLGYPIGVQRALAGGGAAMAFEHGYLFHTPTHGAHHFLAPFAGKWGTGAAQHSLLGAPTTNRINRAGSARVTFERGAMIWSTGTGVRAIYGPIYTEYMRRGGEGGALGLPTSDVVASGTKFRCTFQRGALTYDPATRRVTNG